MVLELAPGAGEITALLEREHRRGAITISYDPNIRLARLGDRSAAQQRIERVVALADLVKVSSEDLAWLLPGASPDEVARDWAGRGPALVVVTLGPDGAIAATSAGVTASTPAPPVDVVDTVGAGDAFMSGLLSGCVEADLLGGPARGRLTGLDSEVLGGLLSRAALVAALTCGRAGADPPSLAELQAAGGAPAPRFPVA
jgi:fructokinase